MKQNNKKSGFRGMLLSLLRVSLLGNLLAHKAVMRAGESTVRVSLAPIFIGSGNDFLMLSHPLSNFQMQNYYQNELKFNYVYSRNNLSKVKDGAYVINRHECKSAGIHCIALHVNDNNKIYFDTFGVGNNP